MRFLSDAVSFISDIVWGTPSLILILGAGVFLSFRLKFFQFTKCSLWLKETLFSVGKAKKCDKKGAISPFRAVCSSLAATVGTGNITGVASAVCIGGPGAVFWMWVAAFFGMATKFSENVLGIYYRRKNEKGEFSGGAMYYLRDGLSSVPCVCRIAKPLSFMFAFFCIFASFGIGNAVQANNIAVTAVSLFSLFPKNVFGIVLSPCFVVGLLLAAVTYVCLSGGLSGVGKITEALVPGMAIMYIAGCLYIIFSHISLLPAAFVSIFKGAFGFLPVCGGGVGFLISQTVKTGIKRGVFSNEAGLASSVTVTSSSSVSEPVSQGMWGIFEVFADTFVICTLTALVILVSGNIDLETGRCFSSLEGTALVVSAFSSSMGDAAAIFVSVSSLLFSFTTILGWSQYGIKACEYLFGVSSFAVYRFVFVSFTVIGAAVSLRAAWDISDIFNGLMALPNLAGLFFLAPTVRKITGNYMVNR